MITLANNIVIENDCTVKIKRLTSEEHDLLTSNNVSDLKQTACIPSDKSILFKDDCGWIFIGVE